MGYRFPGTEGIQIVVRNLNEKHRIQQRCNADMLSQFEPVTNGQCLQRAKYLEAD